MTLITAEIWEEHLSVVRSVVDATWLDAEIEKAHAPVSEKALVKGSFLDKRSQVHPLALLIDVASAQYGAIKASGAQFVLSDNMRQISSLALPIMHLRAARVNGFEAKLSDLSSNDYALFEKTSFEFEIAAMYAFRKIKVEFVETRSQEGVRTPDLLVHHGDGVEVECKKNDGPILDPDLESHYQLIYRRAAAKMAHINQNVRVTIHTKQTLAADQVQQVVASMHNMLEAGGGRAEPVPGITVSVEIGIPIPPGKTEIRIPAPPPSPTARLELAMMPAVATSTGVERIGALFFWTETMPDLVTPTLGAIQKARGQFSGDRPAIIYVKCAPRDEDCPRLWDEVSSIIRGSETISGVVLMKDTFKKDEAGNAERYFVFKRFLNSKARHPAEEEWLLGDPNWAVKKI